MSLPWLFEHWAIEGHQLPPEGDWTTWVILGGRGAGKTRAGAEWIRAQVEGGKPGDPGTSSRVALVGGDARPGARGDGVRDVRHPRLLAARPAAGVAGDAASGWSGRTARRRRSSRRANPESLRGPQFDCAWCDELAKWPKAEAAWDMLQFALRLGTRPRPVVTTTPRDNATLVALIAAARRRW